MLKRTEQPHSDFPSDYDRAHAGDWSQIPYLMVEARLMVDQFESWSLASHREARLLRAR
jgi:hypothetical protein